MLTSADFEILRAAYGADDDLALNEAMRQIGNPSDTAVVASAVAQMSNPDRNVRVLMLRILRHQQGKAAMRGVLAGLNDEARRVRAAAIQASQNYLAYPEIANRLEAIVTDEGLKRKLRARALSMLAGNEGRITGDITPAVYAVLKRLIDQDEYRFSIVFGLARLALAPRIKALLGTLAHSRDPREREMARRALGGERVIHIDAYASDEALGRQIKESCDIAHGRMFYWLPKQGIPAKALAAN